MLMILILVCSEARSREQEQDSGGDAGDYGFDFRLTPGAVCL